MPVSHSDCDSRYVGDSNSDMAVEESMSCFDDDCGSDISGSGDGDGDVICDIDGGDNDNNDERCDRDG